MEQMTLSNMATGRLEEDFQDALAKVFASFRKEDLKDGVRKIKIEIAITQDDSGQYYKTRHVVKLELPVKPKAGVAFQTEDEDGFAVEPLCRETTQMRLPAVVDMEAARRNRSTQE